MEIPSTSSAPNVPNNNDDAIKNWTKEEKFSLIQALKLCGRQDIKKIQEYVITKNLEETKAAVDYFSSIALQHPTFKKQKDAKPKLEKKQGAPLTDWVKLMTDNLNYSELQTETATALRMIADLEKIPPKEQTENIDFKQFYHQLANALEGKPMNPDVGTAALLHKCLIETALSSKAFINSAELKHIVHNIDFSEEKINRFPRPTDDQELAILRHLASQRNFNPLKIPEDNLKPSGSALTSQSFKPSTSKPSTSQSVKPSTLTNRQPNKKVRNT